MKPSTLAAAGKATFQFDRIGTKLIEAWAWRR
jgi:hypothetical protein